MSEVTRIHELQRDGVTLLREVIDPSICRRVRDALTHLRDGGRPRSRQVLYTHRDVPEDRPHLDNLIDQWLSPHRLEGQGSTRELAEGTTDFVAGTNDFGNEGYGGPMPPEGHGPHHYFFWVLALDAAPKLPAGLDLWTLLEKIEPHVLGMNRLVGTYRRG